MFSRLSPPLWESGSSVSVCLRVSLTLSLWVFVSLLWPQSLFLWLFVPLFRSLSPPLWAYASLWISGSVSLSEALSPSLPGSWFLFVSGSLFWSLSVFSGSLSLSPAGSWFVSVSGFSTHPSLTPSWQQGSLRHCGVKEVELRKWGLSCSPTTDPGVPLSGAFEILMDTPGQKIERGTCCPLCTPNLACYREKQ